MDEKQKKKDNQLKRGLNRRHLQMIAIGGSIGTGLFLAMGGTIRSAGPGGAMVGYAIMGIIVYCMMTALGELATEYPVPGAFTAYANRFIDTARGFTNGWSWFFHDGGGRADRRFHYCKILVSGHQFRFVGSPVPGSPACVESVQCQRFW